MSRLLTKIDTAFLKELQHELNTQDNCGTADPHYWKIQETVRVRTFDDGADETLFDIEGFMLLGEDAEKIIDDEMSDICHRLNTDFCGEFVFGSPESLEEKFYCFKGAYETAYGRSTFPYDFGYTEEVPRLANPLFFTLKDCEEHIKRYGYNYTKPKPYCIYSDRTPTFEKLLEILKHVDFDSFEVVQ